MNEKNEEIESIFIIDIAKYSIGDQVVINGIVDKKKKLEKNIEGVWLRDITGKMLALIDTATDPIAQKWDSKSIWVGTRIKITGQIGVNSKEERVLKIISDIQILVSPETELSELDAEMHEHASSMLTSRICNDVSEIMQANHFIEFATRVISNHWNDDGLEPMQVVYPGFGAPAVLIPSPSAQIVDFLTTTLLPRVFTISKSFTESYRFSNSASEIIVIIAKATNIELDTHIQLFKELSEKILKPFIGKTISFTILNGNWPNIIDGVHSGEKQLKEDLNLVKFLADIPVIGKNWDARITTVLHLLDKDKNILAEGTRESLTNDVEISTLTIYPSQFLGLIEKAPRRQLQNLMRLYDGKK